MSDKPRIQRTSGPTRSSSPDLSGSNGLPADFEIRLRSTERVKLVLQRCERCCAPQHLVVRIRETLISIVPGGPFRPH